MTSDAVLEQTADVWDSTEDKLIMGSRIVAEIGLQDSTARAPFQEPRQRRIADHQKVQRKQLTVRVHRFSFPN